jgi:hypothetical protein
VRAGHAYWLAAKGDRALPSRGDFDPPIEIPRLAPNIIIFDVFQEPLDFEYRRIGTKVRAHLIQDLTGVRMSDIAFQRPPRVIWSHHAWVVENAAPRFMRPPYVGPIRRLPIHRGRDPALWQRPARRQAAGVRRFYPRLAAALAPALRI